MRTTSLVVVAVLAMVLGGGAARADDLFRATVVASSTLPDRDRHTFAAIGGADDSKLTQWCEGNPAGAVGESLTITFDHAIALGTIKVIEDDLGWIPDEEHARLQQVDISVDGAPPVRSWGDYQANGALITTVKITIATVGGPAKGIACITRVRLFPPNSSVPVKSCNLKQLAATVRFPVTSRRWVGGDVNGERGHEEVTSVATATELAKLCKTQPRLWGRALFGDGGGFTGPTTAGSGKASLAWIDGRWSLVAVDP